MPRKNGLAKIKSAPKAVSIGLLVVAVAAICIFLGSQQLYAPAPPETAAAERRSLRLAGDTYTLEVADTPAAKAKGLGGRDRLAAGAGMLFSYRTVDQRCFWMKDMRFSIDIIWLDGSKHITHLGQTITPDTYPQSFCADAQHIIEVPAGTAARYGLAVGQQLVF